MTEEEAIEKLKAFAADTEGLEDTFAYTLSNHPHFKGRFDNDLADTRSYGDTLLDHLKGMMDENHMYDIYRESMKNTANDFSAWFKLNAKTFEFFEGIIAELEKETK